MLDEEVEEAGLIGFYLGELFEDVFGYEVGAARAGGEREGFLEPEVLLGRCIISLGRYGRIDMFEECWLMAG